MGDDGTMTKGTRYTPEFRAKAVRLLTASRSSYSSETKAIEQVAKSGDSAGITAALAQPAGRDGRRGDEAVRAGGDGGVEAAAGGEREIAPGERDIDDGFGFFRGQDRPDTALMAAYIDGCRNRFRSGRSAGSCPRRWTAVSSRRAATARSGQGPSAACGRATRRWPATSWTSMPASSPPCTDTARCGMSSSARAEIPGKVGRDQVMNIMRGLGIRGVRRGKTPVATKPATGTGGEPDLVDRKFEAEAPNRLHVADIVYVRMADGRFAYTAFVTDVFARRIVGWACATTMNTEELPLQALEQTIAWAALHGGTVSTVCTTRVMEYGMLPSIGTVGDSYDNAMSESADGAYKTELVWLRRPFHDLKDLELATFRWVSWWNSKRLHQSLGYRTPEAVETEYYTNQAA